MKRMSIALLSILLCGCASVETTRGKIYIKSNTLPTITNDKNYNEHEIQRQQILLRGNSITYRFIMKF